MRLALWIAAGVTWGWVARIDAMILMLMALTVEVMMFRVQVIEALRERGDE